MKLTRKQLRSKIDELQSLKSQRDSINCEIARIEDEIKDHMTTVDQKKMKVGPYNVFFRIVKSLRFDKAKFASEHKELVKRYTVCSVYETFRVTCPKKS